MGSFGKNLGILLAVLLLFVLAACASSIKVNSIAIDTTNVDTQMAVGEEQTLTVTIVLDDPNDSLADVDVEWSAVELQTSALGVTAVEDIIELTPSSDTKSVVVKAVGEGEVEITAEAKGTKSSPLKISITDDSIVEKFLATLEGSQEVPPVETTASGEVSVELNTKDKTITVDGNVQGLGSEITAAHIHKGAAGTAPPDNVVFPLDIDTSNDNTKRSAKLSGSFDVSDSQIADLKADNWYINVHSQDNAPGEVRGQIQIKPN